MSKLFIEIRSGLGNQLFQFAFGYAMAKEFNRELILCPSYFDTLWKYHLKKMLGREGRLFRLPFILKEEFPIVTSQAVLSNSKITVMDEKEASMSAIQSALAGNTDVFLRGYWQNPLQFSTSKEALTRLIVPSISFSKTFTATVEALNENFVGVHVRRGDFLTNRSFGACRVEYYRQSVKAISSIVKNPTIFVFTNDKKWVCDNFQGHFPFKIYDGHSTHADIEELCLMTKLKSLVISNSTFSWWAAYLNANEKKNIVCPSKWFLNPKLQLHASHFISLDWIKVENDLELKS
jgi:hypothetical protein